MGRHKSAGDSGKAVALSNKIWDELEEIIPLMKYKRTKAIYPGGHITQLLLTQGEFSLEIIDILKEMLKAGSIIKILFEERVNPEEVNGDVVKENNSFKVGLTKLSDIAAEIIISKK